MLPGVCGMKKIITLLLLFFLISSTGSAADLFAEYGNLLKQLQSGCKKIDELINKKNQVEARLKSERRSQRDARRDDDDDDDDDDKKYHKKSKKSEKEDEYADYDTTPMTADEFILFLHRYAEENDCRLDEMAELALAAHVDKMELTRTAMNQKTGAMLMDQAIDKAERFTVRSIFFSRYDSEGYLVLKEKHFS